MVATPTLPPNTGAGGSGPSGEIGGVRLGSPYKPSLSLASSPNLSRLTTPQNKNEDTLAKLMESLPMQKVAEKTPRPAIIVVGKRGVGKSTLASTIAAKLGCQIIDSESVDKNEIPGETVPDFTQKVVIIISYVG